MFPLEDSEKILKDDEQYPKGSLRGHDIRKDAPWSRSTKIDSLWKLESVGCWNHSFWEERENYPR